MRPSIVNCRDLIGWIHSATLATARVSRESQSKFHSSGINKAVKMNKKKGEKIIK